jgi:hypothetical protein
MKMCAIDLAVTPNGRPGDASSLAKPGYTGKRKLSDHEREIAHALMRKGMPKQRAIAMARGLLNKAARSGRWGDKGKAGARTVAGAAASIAQRKSFSTPAQEGTVLDMATLKAKKRKGLAKGQFALPGKRKYPIHDRAHAANAKARAAQQVKKGKLSPSAKSKIFAAVKKKYPDMTDRQALAATLGIIDLVGPKGYVHGWKMVGVPAPGAHIRHSRYGSGRVSKTKRPSMYDPSRPTIVTTHTSAAGKSRQSVGPVSTAARTKTAAPKRPSRHLSEQQRVRREESQSRSKPGDRRAYQDNPAVQASFRKHQQELAARKQGFQDEGVRIQVNRLQNQLANLGSHRSSTLPGSQARARIDRDMDKLRSRISRLQGSRKRGK